MPEIKTLHSFPPIVGTKPRILVLGTMPGHKSLLENRYYAHPQNQFWKIMGDLYGAGAGMPYEERLEIIKSHGIAVWDVVQHCERAGSMDADIKNAIPNNFETFFQKHPTITRVIFDSLIAEKLYIRLVLPNITATVKYYRVPSPSPAYAKMPYNLKLEQWKAALAA